MSEETKLTEHVEVPAKFKALIEGVEKMSVLELNELVKVLEKKFGVSAQAVAVAGPATGAAGAPTEEKSISTKQTTGSVVTQVQGRIFCSIKFENAVS